MKQFDYTTLSALLSVVREFLPSMDPFIDEADVIGKVLWCNDTLGIAIREVKEDMLKVRNFSTDLPIDFQKVIYVSALSVSSFGVAQYTDPFDNFSTEADVCTIHFLEGCQNLERRVIQKKCGGVIAQTYRAWKELSLSPSSYIKTASTCINKTMRGEYTIDITDQEIQTPFREGELYMMYFASLMDEQGNIKLPFNPKIFPWYKWCVIEEILLKMVFNSDQDVAQKLKLAQQEKTKAWLDAFNFTIDQSYAEAVKYQKDREMEMFKKYYSWIK